MPSSWIHYGLENFTIGPSDANSPHARYRRSFFVPKAWEDGRGSSCYSWQSTVRSADINFQRPHPYRTLDRNLWV